MFFACDILCTDCGPCLRFDFEKVHLQVNTEQNLLLIYEHNSIYDDVSGKS